VISRRSFTAGSAALAALPFISSRVSKLSLKDLSPENVAKRGVLG
jgi:hypothetical protein